MDPRMSLCGRLPVRRAGGLARALTAAAMVALAATEARAVPATHWNLAWVGGPGTVIFQQDFETGLGPGESVEGGFTINATNPLLNNGTQMMGHPSGYLDLAYDAYRLTLDLAGATSTRLWFDYAGRMEAYYDGFNVVANDTTLLVPVAGLDYLPMDTPITSFDVGADWAYASDALDIGQAVFDISPYDGTVVDLLFQFGSDGSVTDYGINIDNLAVTYGPADGAFHDPANWPGGIVPGPDDHPLFGAVPSTVTFDRFTTTQGLSIRGGGDVVFELGGNDYVVNDAVYVGDWDQHFSQFQAGRLTVTQGAVLCDLLQVGDWGLPGSVLELREGGQVFCQQAVVLGEARVDGPGAALVCGDLLQVGDPDTGVGSLEVTGGAGVSCMSADVSGLVSVAGPDSSWECTGEAWVSRGAAVNVSGGGYVFTGGCELTGSASVIGPTSLWEAGWLEVYDGTLHVGDGAAVNVTGEFAMDGEQVALAGGTINAGSVYLEAGELAGSGIVAGAVTGGPGASIIAAGGELRLGDAAALDGFRTSGRLEVGPNTVVLYSLSFATVGVLTTIDGGTLAAANGVYLPGGGGLSGWGAVDGPLATALGSTILAAGDLVLGDPTRFDGVHLQGALWIGPYTVTLHDANRAVLGSMTTLTAGLLAAPNGLLLPEGCNIQGSGLVTADLVTQGYVHGDPPGLELAGHVSGRGDFGGTVTFSGGYDPGNSTATVSMGSVTFTASAVLGIELDDGSHDRLEIAGDLTAGGGLAIALINGFAPAEGEAFEIIAHAPGRRAGIFGVVTGWDALAGLAIAPFYEDAGVRLVVELLGDADEDDVVGLGDIVRAMGNWQASGEAAGWDRGDVNLDGVVDLSDVVVMIGNWQAVPPPGGVAGGAGGAPVPEPCTLALLVLGGLGALAARRRRRPGG